MKVSSFTLSGKVGISLILRSIIYILQEKKKSRWEKISIYCLLVLSVLRKVIYKKLNNFLVNQLCF